MFRIVFPVFAALSFWSGIAFGAEISASEEGDISLFDIVYYDVDGRTFAELLLSIQANARKQNGVATLGQLQVANRILPHRKKSGQCKFSEVRFLTSYVMILPRLRNTELIPDDVQKEFAAFQAAVRKHEEEHHSIYQNCIKRMRDLILRLPARDTCDAYLDEVADVAKFARAECGADNNKIDRRDGARIKDFPLVRQALRDIADGKVPKPVSDRLRATFFKEAFRDSGAFKIDTSKIRGN